MSKVACHTCMDLGVVARNTPSPYRDLYKGRSLEGRYLDPCYAVGCKARAQFIQSPVNGSNPK